MKKVAKYALKKLERISPSQFYSMKNCAYKSLLAEAFDKKPLLPVSPNAYFGTVLHKMLELISKGEIATDWDFNRNLDNQLRIEEDYLKEQGYDFFVPLQMNVKDFGMKVVLLKKHLRNSSGGHAVAKKMKYLSEKWMESKDGSIGGKIDLIIEGQNEIEIIDFKTGAVTEDILDDDGEIFYEIREEYRAQLKLYAYLYFETKGAFPTKLSLVDLARQKYSVNFSISECQEISEEAKKLLKETNDSLSSGQLPANPSELNCRYCLYRPACSFFIEYLQSNFLFNDVSGKVKKVVKYLNGNVSVFLENGETEILVTNFQGRKYEELSRMENETLNIFNLRREEKSSVYSATKTTIIYEQP